MMSDIPILLRLASLEDDLRQSKYAPFSEDPRDVVKDAHETIRQLRIEVKKAKAQLAARNQAAEAMGVLERLVVGIDHETKSWATLVQCEDGKYELRLYKMTDFITGSPAPSITNANSLIEAVLKAGGEGQ